MKLAVYARPDRPQAVEAANAAAARIRGAGHEAVMLTLDASLEREVAGCEIACVFGGDGTMLRAARSLAPLGIALFGVNLGRLGFLTSATVSEADVALGEILEGRYGVDERALLEAELRRGTETLAQVRALNDVVVARAELVRSIHIAVKVDGEPLIVYWADGLIVATATGSTAYAFSVGGPLILPASRALLMAPIAPHLSFGNSFVFDPDQKIELEVQDEPARLSIDGQEEHSLRVGDVIVVRRSGHVARLVRTASTRPFLALLRQKILKEPGS